MTENSALTVLSVLGLVGVAYLLAHFVVEWIQKRFLVVSGLEYILLGALLGPSVVPEIQALSDLTALAPVIAFAAGWVGLLYGMELNLRKMDAVPDRAARLALTEVSFTAAIVGVLSYVAFSRGWVVPYLSQRDAAVAAWALGAAAAAGSSGAVDLVHSRYKALETELLPLLRASARIGDLLAIIGFGVLFCVYHEGVSPSGNEQSYAEWILITLFGGALLGWLFTIFLGDTTDENHRFLALTGILVFASGAAFFLKISALLVNVVLGAVIVQTSHGKGIYQVLERTSGPVRIVLLVFAGALWKPVPLLPALALASTYILVRVISKSLGGFVATVGTPLRSDLFRGMMAQGDVAVAIAIGFRLVYSGPAVDLAYTAILAAVVVHELSAPRLLKGLLVDAGELRSDIGTVQPAPPRAQGA